MTKHSNIQLFVLCAYSVPELADPQELEGHQSAKEYHTKWSTILTEGKIQVNSSDSI